MHVGKFNLSFETIFTVLIYKLWEKKKEKILYISKFKWKYHSNSCKHTTNKHHLLQYTPV